jgi:hypothetical protein
MRTFAQMIAAIRKSDEALRDAVAETAAYIMLQYHTNGRKADGAGQAFMPQFVAALPAWLQKEAGKWHLQSGKRQVDMTTERADAMVSAMVGVSFASQDEKRRISRENRAARQEAKNDAATAKVAAEDIVVEELETVELCDALIVGSEVIQMSAEEAVSLLDYLNAMRQPKIALAA